MEAEEIRPIKVRNIDQIILYQRKVDRQQDSLLAEEKAIEELIRAQEKVISTEIGITDEEAQTAEYMEKDLFENTRIFIDGVKSGTIGSDDDFGGTVRKAKENEQFIKEEVNNPEVKHKLQTGIKFKQERPKWLQALLLGLKSHAKQTRILRRKIERLEYSTQTQAKENHLNDEIKYLRNRLSDITSTPKKLNYEEWSRHLKVTASALKAPDNQYCRVNNTHFDNYFRYDTLGWSKENGYIMGLSSPACNMNAEEIYSVSS